MQRTAGGPPLIGRFAAGAESEDSTRRRQPEAAFSIFHIKRECAGQIEDDLRVEVPPGQRRSGQAGTESCGRCGDAPSEA
jgi:hypothetical protein